MGAEPPSDAFCCRPKEKSYQKKTLGGRSDNMAASMSQQDVGCLHFRMQGKKEKLKEQ